MFSFYHWDLGFVSGGACICLDVDQHYIVSTIQNRQKRNKERDENVDGHGP